LFLFITLFLVRMRFSSVPKTGLARGARNASPPAAAALEDNFDL
jgi:hypothetical protein